MIRFNSKIIFIIFAALLTVAAVPLILRTLKERSHTATVAQDITAMPDMPENNEEMGAHFGEDIMHGEFAALLENWNNFLDKEVDWSKPAASQIENYRNKNGVPVEIWGDTEDRFESYRESVHPCGRSKTIFAKSFKNESGKSLPVGKVIELKDRKIINTWPIPIDEVPLAIETNKILIDYKVKDTTIAFVISPDYTFTLDEKPGEYQFDPEKYIDCPAFENDVDILSDFTRCYEYNDLKSNQKRILLFEQPCT